MEPFFVGDKVMVIDHTRANKWDPVYEGPFEVKEVHSGGTYTLKDLVGNTLETRKTADMLKLMASAGHKDTMPDFEGGR